MVPEIDDSIQVESVDSLVLNYNHFFHKRIMPLVLSKRLLNAQSQAFGICIQDGYYVVQ